MAELIADEQKFVTLEGLGLVVGIHVVTPTATSGDTIEVPKLSDNADDTSSTALRAAFSTSTVTTTDDASAGLADADNTITLASTIAGEKAIILTIHGDGPNAMVNTSKTPEAVLFP
jgi:hypothetical protein